MVGEDGVEMESRKAWRAAELLHQDLMKVADGDDISLELLEVSPATVITGSDSI